MTGAQLLGLLLLKHGLLAHLVDFGYSASRRQQNKLWYLGLLFHSLAELAGTMYVLSQFSLESVVLVLLIELSGVVATTLFERERLRYARCSAVTSPASWGWWWSTFL